jgi:hypothetical protein
MVPPLFFSQLVLVALVWLCVMRQWAWPSDPATCPPPSEPTPPKPKRHREPQSLAGFTTTPPCDPCIPARRHLWVASAQVWLSHRESQPAQAADVLEPTGTGYGAGIPRYCPVCTADKPGGEHRPTDVSQGHGERRTRQPLSGEKGPRRRRRQPEAAGEQAARSSQGLE